jgi:peptidoglycan/LPS O-acetylase OafA/YrhL
MFFASIITYLIFIFFDDKLLFPTSHQVINVFVSLTFIQPDLISSLTGYQFDFNYISSSYWSLWIEIQFYIFASFFYFFVSKKEYFWFFGTAILLTVFSWLLSHIYTNDYLILKVKSLMTIFNLIDALPFFCLGSAFYVLFNNRARQIRNSNLLLFVFFFFSLFLIFNSIYDSGKILLILIFLSLFYLMIYRPNKIAYLDNLVLHKVGVSSYFLYLIHENIGVLLINKNFINSNYLSVIMPLFFILVFVIISFLFTKDIEIKIIKFFRNYVKF